MINNNNRNFQIVNQRQNIHSGRIVNIINNNNSNIINNNNNDINDNINNINNIINDINNNINDINNNNSNKKSDDLYK